MEGSLYLIESFGKFFEVGNTLEGYDSVRWHLILNNLKDFSVNIEVNYKTSYLVRDYELFVLLT